MNTNVNIYNCSTLWLVQLCVSCWMLIIRKQESKTAIITTFIFNYFGNTLRWSGYFDVNIFLRKMNSIFCFWSIIFLFVVYCFLYNAINFFHAVGSIAAIYFRYSWQYFFHELFHCIYVLIFKIFGQSAYNFWVR